MAVPSTSVLVRVPVAVGVPGMALATPLASSTAAVLVPLMTAASLIQLRLTSASTNNCAALVLWFHTL